MNDICVRGNRFKSGEAHIDIIADSKVALIHLIIRLKKGLAP